MRVRKNILSGGEMSAQQTERVPYYCHVVPSPVFLILISFVLKNFPLPSVEGAFLPTRYPGGSQPTQNPQKKRGFVPLITTSFIIFPILNFIKLFDYSSLTYISKISFYKNCTQKIYLQSKKNQKH